MSNPFTIDLDLPSSPNSSNSNPFALQLPSQPSSEPILMLDEKRVEEMCEVDESHRMLLTEGSHVE